MSSEVFDLSDDTLVEPKLMWSTKYAVPVFVLPTGERYVPDTGEYAGYYSELSEANK